jgi:hypothetical protein
VGAIALVRMEATDGESWWTKPGDVLGVEPADRMLTEGERCGYMAGIA